MELFSQRKGFKPVKNVIQVDSMDEDLRNSLWNAVTVYYLSKMKTSWDGFYLHQTENNDLINLIRSLWHAHFKMPLDTIENIWNRAYGKIREYFFKCEWNGVYDFIEFIANSYRGYYNDTSVNEEFMDFCNSVLKQELSAYRFVNGKIAQITSEEEISAIEDSLKVTSPINPVNNHLKRALDLLTDRKSPDYRNSIKESISAVESICNLIVKNSKATLGQALKEIEKKIELHPALKNAFNNLYGYTSDAEGIRHALLDEPNLDFEDAKFMLVSCSAFINYLVTKSLKAGIKL